MSSLLVYLIFKNQLGIQLFLVLFSLYNQNKIASPYFCACPLILSNRYGPLLEEYWDGRKCSSSFFFGGESRVETLFKIDALYNSIVGFLH
jgi:hypothetical protein